MFQFPGFPTCTYGFNTRSMIRFAVLNPSYIATAGLASSTFARHYSRNLVWFLFLRVLRCFSSPGFLLTGYLIHLRILKHYLKWVPSFGHLRVNGYLLLTAAYRSLSRPSSAPSAKASALCSSSLDLSSSPARVMQDFIPYSLINS